MQLWDRIAKGSARWRTAPAHTGSSEQGAPGLWWCLPRVQREALPRDCGWRCGITVISLNVFQGFLTPGRKQWPLQRWPWRLDSTVSQWLYSTETANIRPQGFIFVSSCLALSFKEIFCDVISRTLYEFWAVHPFIHQHAPAVSLCSWKWLRFGNSETNKTQFLPPASLYPCQRDKCTPSLYNMTTAPLWYEARN